MGSGLAGRGGLLGGFFTGALAVVVAAPCTAPFMGPALGWALTQPPAAALLVFLRSGSGFAAPFVAGGLRARPARAPAAARAAGWRCFRKALAFPMYGAAAWLAWVLAQQAGPDGLVRLLGAAVLVGFAAWLFGHGAAPRRGWPAGRQGGGRADGRCRRWRCAGAGRRDRRPQASAESRSASRVAELRAEGRPVFVNFTAAWCVTCQVNERLALSAPVQASLRRAQRRLSEGRLDPARCGDRRPAGQHGREGVPLYLVYPAGGGAPAVLPQVLTEGIVLRAVAAAAAVTIIEPSPA